jgi:hypothetical protein
LNRGYFEAILMKNTPRTLGVKTYMYKCTIFKNLVRG